MVFQVGEVIHHKFSKTVTAGDHSLFCALTWNPQPLHADETKARARGFGGVLVNGMYTLSLTLGVSVYDLTMEGLIANLSIDEVRYHCPVHLGDTLSFSSEVLAVRPSKSRRGQEVVTFLHTAYNQLGEDVMDCRRSTLMVATSAARELATAS